jgi:hypothetical protein
MSYEIRFTVNTNDPESVSVIDALDHLKEIGIINCAVHSYEDGYGWRPNQVSIESMRDKLKLSQGPTGLCGIQGADGRSFTFEPHVVDGMVIVKDCDGNVVARLKGSVE